MVPRLDEARKTDFFSLTTPKITVLEIFQKNDFRENGKDLVTARARRVVRTWNLFRVIEATIVDKKGPRQFSFKVLPFWGKVEKVNFLTYWKARKRLSPLRSGGFTSSTR